MESRTDSQMDPPNLPDWALVGQQYTASDVKGFTQVLTTLFTVCVRVGVLVDVHLAVVTITTLLRSSEPWIHDFLR